MAKKSEAQPVRLNPQTQITFECNLTGYFKANESNIIRKL